MKALKEKRISLRSLWRMGLVILSVFALAFTACGGSSNDDTFGGGGQIAGGLPVSMRIVQDPTAFGGIVYEGLPVDLSGIVVELTMSDGSRQTIRDSRRFSVSPSIYEYGRWNDLTGEWNCNPGYLVSIQIGTRTVSDFIPIARAHGDFITNIEGVPSHLLDLSTDGFGGVCVICPPGVVHGPLADNLTSHARQRLRRLLNISHTGAHLMVQREFLIDEEPNLTGLTGFEGVYSSFNRRHPKDGPAGTMATYYHVPIPVDLSNRDYRWRWVWNIHDHAHAVIPGWVGDDPGVLIAIGSYGNLVGIWPNTALPPPPPVLTGVRIPVSRIFQVSSFTFATAPDFSRFPIFYDDPSLFYMTSGFDGFTGPGGLTNGAPIPTAPHQWDFDSQNRSDFMNRWIDGVFAGVVFQVTYENGVTKTFPIRDMVFHAEDTPGFWRGLEMQHFIRDGRTRIDLFHHECAVPGVGNQPSVPIEERWDQWSRDREPIIRFVYRGQHVDAQIPIFNRLTGFTIDARVAGETVVMNGRSEVYQRPDLFPEFLMMTRMRAEYTGNNFVGGNIGVREDIVADINARTLRGVEIVLPAVPGDIVAGVHNVVAGTTGDGATGILNREASDRFLRDGRLQTARVTFVATNGTDAGTRGMNARINIGVMNYTNE